MKVILFDACGCGEAFSIGSSTPPEPDHLHTAHSNLWLDYARRSAHPRTSAKLILVDETNGDLGRDGPISSPTHLFPNGSICSGVGASIARLAGTVVFYG